MKTEDITQEQFDKTLRKLLKEYTGNILLILCPEIYTDLAEHFNNDVIDIILKEQSND
jgi:hypothetical protein